MFFSLLNNDISICDSLYCCPYIVIVVTPLLSLMNDQVERFSELGLSCSFVGETQDDREEIAAVSRGERNLVLITPEALTQWRKVLCSQSYQKIFKSYCN